MTVDAAETNLEFLGDVSLIHAEIGKFGNLACPTFLQVASRPKCFAVAIFQLGLEGAKLVALNPPCFFEVHLDPAPVRRGVIAGVPECEPAWNIDPLRGVIGVQY